MANSTYEEQAGVKHTNLAVYVNILGSVLSLMVFLGIVAWGAKMISRDSLGVPVVRALDGSMRIAPEDPGGVLASHQGLTVNNISSSREKLPLGVRLRLAPPPITLQVEDQPTAVLLAAAVVLKEVSPLIVTSEVSLALDVELSDIRTTGEGSVKMLLASTVGLPDIATKKSESLISSNSAVTSFGTSPTSSVRPRMRSLFSTASPVLKPATAVLKEFSQGSPMAQLGAFRSQNIAMQAWINILQKYGDYLAGREHIILKAEVIGGVIYRLRVQGFSNLAEVRSFCNALNSQNAECYSVVMN